MEATRLSDPAFWVSGDPAFPGVAAPSWAGEVPGLVWFRTSGTTGAPRWIGHSREALLLSAAVVNRYLGVGEDDVWGLALPLRHVGGFGVVARSFEAGTELAPYRDAWDPCGFARWLEGRRVNHLSLVPTQVHDLVRAGCRAPGTLRTLVVGGGVLSEADGRTAREMGWPVLPSYGMTEAASQIATASPEVLDQPYFAAPLPVLPHWELEIRDDQRIAIRGGALFQAELVEQGEGMDLRDRRGAWYLTGDRGRRVDGGIVIIGRADARVKVLGELVDPVEIERRIGVPGAVVVAVPDRRRQHRLILAVEDGEGEAGKALARYNADATGPERVEGPVRVEAFPRSGLGKVRRLELAGQVAGGIRGA